MQIRERAEIEPAVSPLERLDAVEAVRLEAFDSVGVDGFGPARHAKGSVVHVAAGAACNLSDLARRQIAMVLSVEFPQCGKCDVIEIEVEAHADRIGRDEKLDIAGLIESDLGVARPGRKRAEHDGRAAALATDQLGNRVNVLRRKRDDRRPRRQPRNFFLAAVCQFRKAGPRYEICARDQIADGVAHGLRAEQQRLRPAACVQQPVCEDVAALGIASQLNFIDRQEIDIDIARHRLDGRYPVPRLLGFDLFFARDQGDLIGADPGLDLVVDFPRKKPQRQTDHAALMAEHALDREMRFACVCRSEHRGYVTNAGLEITYHVVLGSGSSPGIAERGCEIKDLFRSFRPVSGCCGGRAGLPQRNLRVVCGSDVDALRVHDRRPNR